MSRRFGNTIPFETMEAVRDSVDIGFDSEGDIMLTSNIDPVWANAFDMFDMELSLENDIARFGNINGRILEQMIMKRLLSTPGDWEQDPYSGAYLNQFIGEKINPSTLSAIKNTIITSLTHDSLIRTGNIIVEVIPVTKHIINILMLVRDGSVNRRFSFGFYLHEHGTITKW